MTWHYQTSRTELKIWDHTQDPATDTPLRTYPNDGNGFDTPDAVYSVMREEWQKSVSLGNSPVMDVRAGEILMDLVTDDIEEYNG